MLLTDLLSIAVKMALEVQYPLNEKLPSGRLHDKFRATRTRFRKNLRQGVFVDYISSPPTLILDRYPVLILDIYPVLEGPTPAILLQYQVP
jgi:hypothetical protein